MAGASAPTFGDLAVFIAKGYFKSYVKKDASMEQCVAFLNRQGICFSLFDLLDPNKTVSPEDCARVVGQSMLLFSGEAVVVNGCIKKPLEMENWVDYCLLNDVVSGAIWKRLAQSTSGGSFSEVRQFFKKKPETLE
jgi:hypothetical protein